MIEDKNPGEAIKEIRLQKGITQKQIADAIGTSEASICRWENGSRQITVKRFEEILDVLGANLIVQWWKFE